MKDIDHGKGCDHMATGGTVEPPEPHRYVVGREDTGFDAVEHAMPRPASTRDFDTRVPSLCGPEVRAMTVMGAGLLPFVPGDNRLCPACTRIILDGVGEREPNGG